MHEICQLNDDNCSCSDNGIMLTDNYQDIAKQGVIKKIYGNEAYYLYLLFVLRCLRSIDVEIIALLTYLFVT